jgi:hypothetical protein
MASTRRLRVLIAGIATVAALLMLPALASANVYCVDVSGGDCTNLEPSGAFQTALNDAKANPGDDTVRLGGTTMTPITYTTATPLQGFNYVGGDGVVSIVGAGQGKSILTVAAQPDVFAINEVLVVNHAGSSVSDLTITLPTPTPPNTNVPQYRGIDASLLAISNVTVSASASPTNGFGIFLTGGSIQDSTVTEPVGAGFPSSLAIAVGSGTTIDHTTAAGDTAVRASAGTLAMKRSSLRGGAAGLRITAGSATVESSTIDLAAAVNGGTGVDVGNPNNGAAENISLTADHLTLANGGTNSTGLGAFANDPIASITDNTSVTMTNSVINGPVVSIRRQADNGDTANVTTDYSNYNAASNVSSNGTSGAGSMAQAHQTNLAPGFANAGSGDFHLLGTSSLIDVGNPAHPPPGDRDIDGDAREIFGKDNCFGARRDIGADEFVPLSPPTLLDCLAPNTSILSGPSGVTTDNTPTFSFASSEASSTFRCGVDGGTFAACSSPFTAPGLGDGPHTVAVKARDPSLNEDASPATRSFTVDATAPDTSVSGKAKVKTRKKKARVTFTLGASEPGSTFACSLDGAPLAPCSSPFSAKLRRGGHTLTVRATDTAGNTDQSPASFTTKVKKRKTK